MLRVDTRYILGRGFLATFLLMIFAGAPTSNAFTVYNTGVDSAGAKLAPGSTDSHWQVISGPGITSPIQAVVANNQHPSGQYFATANSMWVSWTASALGTTNTPYTYELTFDLTGYDPASAVLSGLWGVDNFGSITLNGLAPIGTGTFILSGTSFDHFNTTHEFSITGGFVDGVNSLQIQVVDTGNPSGLNVSALVGMANPVPEPTGLMLMFVGLIAIGSVYRASRADT